MDKNKNSINIVISAWRGGYCLFTPGSICYHIYIYLYELYLFELYSRAKYANGQLIMLTQQVGSPAPPTLTAFLE